MERKECSANVVFVVKVAKVCFDSYQYPISPMDWQNKTKNEQYLVLGDRDTVSLDGEVSTLVHKGADGLLRRVSVVVWWR